MKLDILCFPNGNYAVCADEKQIPEANGSWLLMIADKLTAEGLDPLQAEITLPNGRQAQFFRTQAGTLNWNIL